MNSQLTRRNLIRSRTFVSRPLNVVRRAPVVIARASKAKRMTRSALDALFTGYQRAMTDKYVLVTIAIVAFVILTHPVKDAKFTAGVIFDLLAKYPDNTLLTFIQTHYQRFFGFLILLPTAVAMRKAEQTSATLVALVIAIVLPPIPTIEYILIAVLIGMFMFCQARDYTCKVVIIIAGIVFYTLGWITLAQASAPPPAGGRNLNHSAGIKA